MAVSRYPKRVKPSRPRGVLPTVGPRDIRGIPSFNPLPVPSTGPSGNPAAVSNSGVFSGRQARSDINVDSAGRTGHHPAFAIPSSPLVRQQANMPTSPVMAKAGMV